MVSLGLANDGLSSVDALLGQSIIDDFDVNRNYVEDPTANWTGWQNSNAFEGDYRVLSKEESGKYAEFKFVNLAAGTYDLYATWPEHESRTSAAQYSVQIGTDQPTSHIVSQRFSPQGDDFGSRPWQLLQQLMVGADGSITVHLTGGADGNLAADAVRLERTVLPNLATLDLHGNPLDNAAHQYVLAELQSRDVDVSYDANSSPPQLDPLGPIVLQANRPYSFFVPKADIASLKGVASLTSVSVGIAIGDALDGYNVTIIGSSEFTTSADVTLTAYDSQGCSTEQRVMVVSGLDIGQPATTASNGSPAPPILGKTLFVDAHAVGENGSNGNSWVDAYKTLNEALETARSANSDPLSDNDVAQIWVADGVYTPGSNRTSTFELVNGVAIYGGFAGGELDLNDRPRDGEGRFLFETVLSGDLLGNDADNWDLSSRQDNSFSVVFASDLDRVTVVSGVTITGGCADGDDWAFGDDWHLNRGGGIYIAYESNVTLIDVILRGNVAEDFGGGIYAYLSSVMLSNVTLSGNKSTYGGAIGTASSVVTLANATLSGNESVVGGGLAAVWSTVTLANTTLSDNSASYAGGIYSDQAVVSLTNTTVSDNRSESYGGIWVESSTVTLANSIIARNSSPYLPDGLMAQVPISGGHNLIGDGSGMADLVLGQNGNLVGNSVNPIDPLLAPLGWYGGPTMTNPPTWGRPAIDVGNANLLPADAMELDHDGKADEHVPR